MKKVLSFFVNTIYFTIVIVLAFSIATIALTRKVNESQSYVNNLHGSVVKDKVTVLTLTSGIVTKINVKAGQTVKKGDVLVEMSNPVLESSYKLFEQHTDNESAQTQASIAKASLNNLTITAPVDGVVGDLYTSEGSSVDEFSKVMVIYSSNDIRLQADLTADQYQKIQKLSKIAVYSSRLNQDFTITPSLLKADEMSPTGPNEKKVGIYFSFKDNKQAAALLNNEDLSIKLDDDSTTRKPIDYSIDFWNGLLARNN